MLEGMCSELMSNKHDGSFIGFFYVLSPPSQNKKNFVDFFFCL
jgi:hypothetical protein